MNNFITENIEVSCDSFHRGSFYLLQPTKKGHRSGIDALLLASVVPTNFFGTVVDLGAGVGAAAFAVLSRCEKAKAVLVENDHSMLSLAHKTHELQQNIRYKDRLKILTADVCSRGQKRIQAGLGDKQFDFVIFNPPFNSTAETTTPDSLKAKAHVMSDNMFEQWLKTAAVILKDRGNVAFIARPFAMQAMLNALEKYFGAIVVVPIYARSSKEAIRVIIRARKASKKPLEIAPPLVLHGETGNDFLPIIQDLLNGKLGLFER